MDNFKIIMDLYIWCETFDGSSDLDGAAETLLLFIYKTEGFFDVKGTEIVFYIPP